MARERERRKGLSISYRTYLNDSDRHADGRVLKLIQLGRHCRYCDVVYESLSTATMQCDAIRCDAISYDRMQDEGSLQKVGATTKKRDETRRDDNDNDAQPNEADA
jgi:hypothetical protein